MFSLRRNYLLLFVVAALLGVTSTQALSQAKRKGQPRSGRTARVGATARASLTPTDAVKAYYQAVINRDGATIKKYVTAGTLRLMQGAAKKGGMSLDDAMMGDARWSRKVMPRLGNERITGASATVDVLDEGRTMTLPMVYEGGGWKLALDRLATGPHAQSPPAPPAAEGNYSEEEKHRLFQTVGITQDVNLIIEVAQRIGIVDAQGDRKPNFDAFVKAHYEWAMTNAEFIQQHLTDEKARAYVMAHK